MMHEVVTGLVYWRAIELAGIGHLSELTRLILRGDKFPAEHQPALEAYVSGARRPRRRRDLKPLLNYMEAPVARMLFKALTCEHPKDADKQARRFVRTVTRELLNETNTPNGKVNGERSGGCGIKPCNPQVARQPPAGVEDIARMSEDEAIARMTFIFACTARAVCSAARLDKNQESRLSLQHWTPRASLAMGQTAAISLAPVADGTSQRAASKSLSLSSGV